MNDHELKVGNHKVEIPNWNKILFDNKKFKKKDIVQYYEKISSHILPFLKDRVIVLQRFPDGIEKEGFFQKKYQDHYPDFLQQYEVELVEGGHQQQLLCQKKADLIYLVGQATISFHPWLSTTNAINKPNLLIFDLDPPEDNINIDHLVLAAQAIKKILVSLSLKSYVMTTGSTGLHVVAPIEAAHAFDTVRGFAEKIANHIADQHSDKLTTELRKEKRQGRVFIDYTRNAYGQTAVAPYSLRALPAAPIATPLGWHELTHLKSSQDYTIDNMMQRLGQVDNPWQGYDEPHVLSKKILDEIRKLDN